MRRINIFPHNQAIVLNLNMSPAEALRHARTRKHDSKEELLRYAMSFIQVKTDLPRGRLGFTYGEWISHIEKYNSIPFHQGLDAWDAKRFLGVVY